MFADFDIAGGCGLAREYSAEVRGQGTILPRLALPPLCGRAQRSARSPEVNQLIEWLVGLCVVTGTRSSIPPSRTVGRPS